MMKDNSKRHRLGARLSSVLLLLGMGGWLVLSSGACHYYNLEKKLDPGDAEFYSQVRYIMTKEESRIFLELPESERAEFKDEFWMRRDPTPDTEENEFKMEYYDRIEKAAEMFISEGKAGWLTDRGHIYILFGPPTDRLTNPMGGDPYSRCRELWYYGNFPVLFHDDTCTGNYRLVTYDLTSLRDFNLMYMHEFNRAQQAAQRTFVGESKLLDFDWDVRVSRTESDRIEGKVRVEVPYASLWFKDLDEKLQTVLEIRLEVRDTQGEVLWDFRDDYAVETDETELKGAANNMVIDIPIAISQDVDRMLSGSNRIFISVSNRTGGDSQKKVRDFII